MPRLISTALAAALLVAASAARADVDREKLKAAAQLPKITVNTTFGASPGDLAAGPEDPDPAHAVATAVAEVEADAGDADAWTALVDGYRRLGDEVNANKALAKEAEAWRARTKAAPDDGVALAALAGALHELGDAAGADEALARAATAAKSPWAGRLAEGDVLCAR